MIFLKLLWSKVWPYIAGAGALLAALLAVRQSGKQAGRDEVRREVDENNRVAVERARNVENETAAMGDDAVADELARDWVRRPGAKR